MILNTALLHQDKPSSIAGAVECFIIKVVLPTTSTTTSTKFVPGPVVWIQNPAESNLYMIIHNTGCNVSDYQLSCAPTRI